MKFAVPLCANGGISVSSHGKLSDLECADEVVFVREDPSNLQVFLDCVAASLCMFGMHFAFLSVKYYSTTELTQCQTMFFKGRSCATQNPDRCGQKI